VYSFYRDTEKGRKEEEEETAYIGECPVEAKELIRAPDSIC
jgi:hypothetical protein